MCSSHTAMYKFSSVITVLSNVHKRLILGLPAPRTISGCCAQGQPESQPQVNHRVAVQPTRLDASRDHTLSTEGYSCHCICSPRDREWNELAQAIPCSNLVRGRTFVVFLNYSRQISGYCLKSSHDRFLPHPCQVIIIKSRRCSLWHAPS